jgi:hypothetical protein
MLKIEFQSKHPHHTAWIEVSGPVPEVEAALNQGGVIADLLAIGWRLSIIPPAPPFDGMTERDIQRDGSAVFRGWTADEKVKFVAEAKAVLKKHGYTGVKWRKMRLEDLL